MRIAKYAVKPSLRSGNGGDGFGDIFDGEPNVITDIFEIEFKVFSLRPLLSNLGR